MPVKKELTNAVAQLQKVVPEEMKNKLAKLKRTVSDCKAAEKAQKELQNAMNEDGEVVGRKRRIITNLKPWMVKGSKEAIQRMSELRELKQKKRALSLAANV